MVLVFRVVRASAMVSVDCHFRVGFGVLSNHTASEDAEFTNDVSLHAEEAM